ncbi:MAG: ribosome biogenesis factor YjgA, partial [Pseudomonadota bacterium]
MDDKPSKSARKRAAQAIRAMADELVDLKPQVLEALIKDNDLLHAIREAQQTNSHGALRRQKQYIARLMRELDHDEIRDALDALAGDPAKEKQLFR